MRPPPSVLAQMEILSAIKAALTICVESPEYKSLANKEALKLHDLSMKMEEIIELIEKRYNDENANLAFMIAAVKLRDSPNFLRDFNKTYSRKCAPQLLIDAESSINSVRSKVRGLTK